jgi:putative transposase
LRIFGKGGYKIFCVNVLRQKVDRRTSGNQDGVNRRAAEGLSEAGRHHRRKRTAEAVRKGCAGASHVQNFLFDFHAFSLFDAENEAIGRLWKENWERVIPFFEFPPEVRRVIYTTNAVESLHMSLRKVIKTRGSFPSEEAALKLLYLALRNASAKWDTIQHWKQALNHFQMLWGERIQTALSR